MVQISDDVRAVSTAESTPARDSTEAMAALVSQLDLACLNKKKGRCIKYSSTLESGEVATSWKFNDWDYGSSVVELPTQARGLFTLSDNSILIRGYDKFFNIGEKPSTTPESIKENTVGPYGLTLKENGCIIFITGLANGKIVATSKHSIGERDGMQNGTKRNHAYQGELEVCKQLSAKGIPTEVFAKQLYERNLTAVAELCDDSFEEHVLPYSKEEGRAGLYLHGLNYNTIKFQTCPMAEVDKFADEFGFHKIEHFSIATYPELMKFLDKCSETGTYNGIEVEGFVIRCKSRDDNSDFFFKHKFEEPYLFYRQLREVTRKFLTLGDVGLVKYGVKKHRYITYHYIDFIDKLFKEQPELATEYANGHGIIKVRELFFKAFGKSGMDLFSLDALDSTLAVPDAQFKYILVPIATIGCGKTTTFQTLLNLFPELVGHIQNDNLDKKSKFNLVDSCLNELAQPSKKIVCCDRNNHMYRERTQLFKNFEDSRSKFLINSLGLKFICCNFTSPDRDTLWDVTYERVVKRGDNHQSIKASGEDGIELAKKIMGGFLSRHQPLNVKNRPDNQFDLVIDLEVSPQNSSLDNAKLLFNKLNDSFPGLFPYIPSDEQFQESFEKALTYTPEFTKIIFSKESKAKIGSMKTAKSPPKPTYFATNIAEKERLLGLVEAKIASAEAACSTWAAIRDSHRVQPEFHVTLSHAHQAKISPEKKKAWKHFLDLFAKDPNVLNTNNRLDPSIFMDIYSDVKLLSIVIVEEKLVCAEVEILRSYNAAGEAIEGIETSNVCPHITMGTVAQEVKAYQSNVYLEEVEKLREDEPDKTYELDDGISARVIKLDEEVIFEKQRLYAHK